MPPLPSKKVLVVEDEVFIQSMYADQLRGAGFLVSTAGDGEAGLAAVEENQPDAVLLDILLPKLDGFEMLKRLRANPRFAKVPVIILTNLSQPEDVERGLALGANDYLVKARFLPSEIVDKVKSLLTYEV